MKVEEQKKSRVKAKPTTEALKIKLSALNLTRKTHKAMVAAENLTRGRVPLACA